MRLRIAVLLISIFAMGMATAYGADTWSYPSSSIKDPTGKEDTTRRDGSIEKPYTISNAQELANFAYYVNNKFGGDAYYGKYVVLTADIVLNDRVINEDGTINTSAKEWTPIGEYGTLWNDSFEGYFDGQGHTISGVYIKTSRDYNGLFGDLKHGNIKNLHVKDSYIANGTRCTGGVVAHIHGNSVSVCVENCSFQGVVENSSSSCNHTGGIIGHIEEMGTSVRNCHTEGRIIGTKASDIGGICAYPNSSVNFINCTNKMNITGGASGSGHVGGIAGKALRVKECINYGSITNSQTQYIGGIVGEATDTIMNSNNLGNIVAGGSNVTHVGGIAGKSSSVKECINYGSITNSQTKYIGGIVGEATNTIMNSNNLGNIVAGGSNVTHIGGIVGWAKQNIFFCGNMGNINASNATPKSTLLIGGIVGQTEYPVRKSYNHGDISATSSNAYCGGIIGEFKSSVNYGYIDHCFNVGKIESSNGYGIVAKATTSGFDMSDSYVMWLEGTSTQGFPMGDGSTMRSSNYFTTNTIEGNAFDIMEKGTGVLWGSRAEKNGYPIPIYLGGKNIFFYTQGEHGTSDNPYKIESIEDFNEINRSIIRDNDFAGEYFVQLSDLDFSDVENFQPTGVKYNIMDLGGTKYDHSEIFPFAGSYDGNGYTIKGVRINNQSKYGAAIFANNYGTIKNLTIEDYANGDDSNTPTNTGSLVINNYGTVSNIIVKNSNITANRGGAGGIAGVNYGLIEKVSVFNTTIKGFKLGGIVGVSEQGVVKHCTSAATLDSRSYDSSQGAQPYIGGVAGWSNGITIENGYFTCDTTQILFDATLSPMIGGCVGYADRHAQTIKSFVAPWNAVHPNTVCFGEIIGRARIAAVYSIHDLIIDFKLRHWNNNTLYYGLGKSTDVARYAYNIQYTHEAYSNNSISRTSVTWISDHFNSDSIVQGYYIPLPLGSPTTYPVNLINSDSTGNYYLDITAQRTIDNTIFEPATQDVVEEFYNLPNVIDQSGVVRNLVITDGKDFAPEIPIQADSISYRRDSILSWSVMCLPFDIHSDMLPDGSFIEQVNSISNDSVYTYKVDGEIEAGTPFFLYSENDDFVLSLSKGNIYNTTTTVNNDKLHGTLQGITLQEGDYCLDSEGVNFVRVDNDTTILAAFGAYIPQALVGDSYNTIHIIHSGALSANIESENNYYIRNEDLAWPIQYDSDVVAVFTNANTHYTTTVKGEVIQNIVEGFTYTYVLFYLAEGNSYISTGVENARYTHVEFKLMNGEEVVQTTGALYYTDAEKPIYNLAQELWQEYDNTATGLDEVTTEKAIIICNDKVVADGAIYIYNVNGVMVAYGYNEIDLTGLQSGIYFARCGNTVRKVVR